MDLIAKLDELVPKSDCVYNALEPILVSCRTPENIAERIWLSVQLSQCEFAAAHVSFPYICDDPSKMTQCTQLLETKSTWWTTYSGNYQHISTICQEYQPLFESKRQLEIYKNASAIFEVYETEVTRSLNIIMDAITTSSKLWEETNKGLSTEISQASSKLAELQLAVNFDKTQQFIDQVNLLLLQTSERVNDMMVVTNDFEQRSFILENRLIEAANALQESVTQTTAVLSEADVLINRYTRAITLLFELSKALWTYSLPLLYVMIVSLIIYRGVTRFRNKKRIPRISYSENPQIDPYNDPIFY